MSSKPNNKQPSNKSYVAFKGVDSSLPVLTYSSNNKSASADHTIKFLETVKNHVKNKYVKEIASIFNVADPDYDTSKQYPPKRPAKFNEDGTANNDYDTELIDY